MLYLYLLIAVQIVIESLPISSSGHVTLLERMMSTCGTWVTSIDTIRMFCSALPEQLLENMMRFAHGATLIILAFFFAQPLYVLITHRRLMYHAVTRTIPYVIVADCVTAVWYVAIHEKQLIHIPLYAGFAITMLILYSTHYMYVRTRVFKRGIRSAVFLGCAQGIALLPGISRLAMVYTTACALGFRPERAFEIAWAIHAPLMLAVTFLGWYRLQNMRVGIIYPTPTDVAVIISSCILGYVGLYVTWRAVQKGTLWRYAWYMPVPLLLSLVTT